MAQIARLSGSATVQSLVGTASWIGLVRIISTFGSAALAGYAIGIRVVVFALLPSFGMSNAAATMVGQALGAGNPERAEEAVWKAGLYNLCFLGGIGAHFVLFAPALVSLFTRDPAVAVHAVSCLRIVASGFLFYAYGMVLTQSFNGAGDTFTPTLINLVVFWLWEIPLAYVLAIHFGLGPRGVFWSITIAFSTLAVVSAVLFRRGKWKTRKILIASSCNLRPFPERSATRHLAPRRRGARDGGDDRRRPQRTGPCATLGTGLAGPHGPVASRRHWIFHPHPTKSSKRSYHTDRPRACGKRRWHSGIRQ